VWREEQGEFVFLVGFQKSGRTTIPANAMAEAMRLREELEEGRGHTYGHSDDVEEAVE
jgi:hypothetical protein